MASARIHEVIAIEINKDYNYDELLLRIGTVAPDSWRNIRPEFGFKDKYLSHFWDFRIKNGQSNDYQKFYLKYYDNLNNPFYFGYLLHLMVDQYWKTYIESRYIMYKDGIRGYRLKNGNFHDADNYYSHNERIKIQKQLAKIYNLSNFPIMEEDINNFQCNIDEFNTSGLFGINGTLNYINTVLSNDNNYVESELYDINDIINYIYETCNFIRQELKRLNNIKIEYDKKYKIAIDIDDTILCTKQCNIVDYNKDTIQESLNKLLQMGYIVDLLSNMPISNYSLLYKKIVDYFQFIKLNYNYINLVLYEKAIFLRKYNYDILIDYDIKSIKEVESVGIIPILYGKDNNYNGYQTNNWEDIPLLVNKILKKKK